MGDYLKFLSFAFVIVFFSCDVLADDRPKVIAVWASGPLEVRVAFDRAAMSEGLSGLVGTRIVFGDGVKPGDRFVARKPGDPPIEARGSLRIAAARLDDGGRTLVLSTDPHPRDTTYALSLPPVLGGDLVYGLRGVEVTWDDGKEDAKPTWSGWRPTFDRVVGSNLPMKAGRVTLKTLVSRPKGMATFNVRASSSFELGLGNETVKSTSEANGHHAEINVNVDDDRVDLIVTLAVDGKLPLTLVVEADGQPITADRLTLPWAPPIPTNSPSTPAPTWALSGGDPSKGEVLFKGEGAKCSICHKVRGAGGDVGPDLTDLIQRDRAWIYRQINEPSSPIHPDYVPYTVLTKDGRVLVGIVRAEGADAIKVVDAEAKATVVAKAEIEELKPSATSIMPATRPDAQRW